MKNLLAHLKTAKHQLAVADDKNSKVELQNILYRVNTSRASNPEAATSNKNMENSTKIKIDFKKAQIKYFSSGKTLNTFANV